MKNNPLVKSEDLFFQSDNSDKEYHLQLIEVKKDEFVVNFQYGRRGGNLKDGTKTLVPVSLSSAERIYDTILKEKLGKGYRGQESKKK